MADHPDSPWRQQPPLTHKPSDADSLLASALLGFRSGNRGTTREGQHPQTQLEPAPALPQTVVNEPALIKKCSSSPASLPPKKTARVHNPIVPNLPFAQASTPPAFTTAPPGCYASNPTSVFSPEQIAALRAAAAAGAVSFAAAASNPFGHQLDLLRQVSFGGGGTPISSFSPLHSTAALPLQTMSTSVPNPLVSSTAQATVALESEGNRARADSIRREQVEAALKSKPQRGRKREDLSELERMELTRTRNREHAKSTRIRKKARHQELLDIEKKFDEMEQRTVLDAKRRQTISQFLKIREQMVHSFLSSDSSHSSGERTAPASNTTLAGSWDDLVEDPAQFQFDEGWQKDEDHVIPSAERMRRFDEYVYSSVTAKFGNMLVPMLRYGVKGEENGIALDAANGGLAEVELYLALPTKVYLMTGTVRFRFGAWSEKLQSVTHVHAMDLLASSERLNAQISYPSTVSLDPPVIGASLDQSKADAKHDDSGPGMNI